MFAFPSYSEDDKARPSDMLAVLKKLLSLHLEQQVCLVISTAVIQPRPARSPRSGRYAHSSTESTPMATAPWMWMNSSKSTLGRLAAENNAEASYDYYCVCFVSALRYASGQSLSSLAEAEAAEWRDEFAELDEDVDNEGISFAAFRT